MHTQIVGKEERPSGAINYKSDAIREFIIENNL
jgi:hypothetical protein